MIEVTVPDYQIIFHKAVGQQKEKFNFGWDQPRAKELGSSKSDVGGPTLRRVNIRKIKSSLNAVTFNTENSTKKPQTEGLV